MIAGAVRARLGSSDLIVAIVETTCVETMCTAGVIAFCMLSAQPLHAIDADEWLDTSEVGVRVSGTGGQPHL